MLVWLPWALVLWNRSQSDFHERRALVQLPDYGVLGSFVLLATALLTLLLKKYDVRFGWSLIGIALAWSLAAGGLPATL